MMQPPRCLKIWRVVLRNVLYWICPEHITLHSGQKVHDFGTFFFSSITLDACFGIFLYSQNGTVKMLPVDNMHSGVFILHSSNEFADKEFKTFL